MNVPRSLVFAIMFVTLVAGVSAASDIFFAPTSAGSNNGTSCANAYAYNDPTHGWNKSGQQVAGNVLHICPGTYSSSTSGANLFTAVNSGSSGNPITLIADQGPAVFSNSQYWGGNSFTVPGAAIFDNGNSFWVFNGDGNLTIYNSLNGTSGAACPGGTCSNFTGSGGTTGVYVNASNVTIENLTVGPMYVHLQDDGGGANAVGIFANNCNACNITGNTMTQAYQPLNFGYSGAGSITSATIANNSIDYACHMIQIGDATNGSTASGFLIYGNTIGPHNTAWTGSSNGFCHQDGIFINAANSGSQLSSSSVYNNLITSDMCNATGGSDANFNCTAPLYYAGTFNGINTFNNVIAMATTCGSGQCGYEGNITVDIINGGGETNMLFANNTIVGDSSPTSRCDCAGIENYDNGGSPSNSGWVSENNIFTNFANTAYLVETNDFNTIFGSSIDYNDYYSVSRTGVDFANSQNYFWSTPAMWKQANAVNSFPGYDAHGSTGNPNLNSSYFPQTGSAAIGLAKNLNSVCNGQPNPGLGALCYDAAGVARPASGAWDAGAYQFSSSAPPAPPTSLTASVQ